VTITQTELTTTITTLINACYPDWGFRCRLHTGKTVRDCLPVQQWQFFTN